MGDLSEHFSRSELVCHHCGLLILDPALIPTLEALRAAVGEPLAINSGYRCPVYNAQIGGGPEHPAGQAADIAADDYLKAKIIDAASQLGIKRRGVMKTAIHIGISKTLPQGVLWGYQE